MRPVSKFLGRCPRLCCLFILVILAILPSTAQTGGIRWDPDGKSYYSFVDNELYRETLPARKPVKIVAAPDLVPSGSSLPLPVEMFNFSSDRSKVLLFTNTRRVWRLNTRGDYWVRNLEKGSLVKLGRNLPEASLMFAKFSPDGRSVAYVSGNNIYTESLETGDIREVTSDGSVTLINGTFDWAYEEEFFSRDGFRWSPDSRSIAFWQLDAGSIRKFYMINNTDSVYSRPIPIEYPITGEKPSKCRIGVADLISGDIMWMDIPGEPDQNYLIRMEFIPSSSKLLVQQLNRRQNTSRLFIADPGDGSCRQIYEEVDSTWVDVTYDGNYYAADFINGFNWLDGGRSILWSSEKDGWRHLYRISLEGLPEVKLTDGIYDIIDVGGIDPDHNLVYFTASPLNATQKYLYSVSLTGKGKIRRLSPDGMTGTHDYSVAPGGKYAMHSFSNTCTRPAQEFISLPDHKPVDVTESIGARLEQLTEDNKVEFFTVKTADGIEMDGWMVKPLNFDPAKKYPVVFYVYTEPWDATVRDSYGIADNYLYQGDMAEDGYISVSLDGRGTPAPKGREWRKAIYKSIGQVNIRDQAMAAEEILKWDFIDPDRVAVWGWSGGGSATLNLMFQYPGIYKTGIAIAAVANLLTYDNIYQERYMGLPQENMDAYIKGSPLTYASKLAGNLLYIHGTRDDNVHYQNAEMLINELIKYNKQFQFMAYPNRSHGIYEGSGTREHLSRLYTDYLRKFCPPGGR